MLGLLLVMMVAQVELPPEARQPPPPPKPTENVVQRGLLEGGGAVVGTGAALGIALAFTLPNPGLDTRFANAALGALLMTGGAFALHEALGGRGEITLALLTSIVSMVAGALVGNAIDPTLPMGAVWASAVAALPGAALAVLALEGTTPKKRPAFSVNVTGSGFTVRF